MVSCSMYFRRMIRVMAMAAVVLLLSGCSAALTDSETPDTVLPGLPESTTAPAATGTTLPQASPETEEPSEQPEEKEPCGFLPPAEITVSFRDETGIFMARNQHLLALSPEDEAVTFQADSPDGSACALLTSRNQLWLIRGQQLTAVGECNGFFALSADGSALIYTDQGGILLRYACDSGESTSISAAPSFRAVTWFISQIAGKLPPTARFRSMKLSFRNSLSPKSLISILKYGLASGFVSRSIYIAISLSVHMQVKVWNWPSWTE